MEAILEFLSCETPDSWIDVAKEKQNYLLIDHANCEKKAAGSAMNLMYRYTTKPELLKKMSQLAREELLHFQQVVEILAARKIAYVRLGPSRYSAGLRNLFSGDEHQRLIDTLIAGAFIEARSCERFASLVPHLDEELAKFYISLLKSEARHFQDYMELAELYSEEDISERTEEFRQRENELISTPDTNFRFHSGVPMKA